MTWRFIYLFFADLCIYFTLHYIFSCWSSLLFDPVNNGTSQGSSGSDLAYVYLFIDISDRCVSISLHTIFSSWFSSFSPVDFCHCHGFLCESIYIFFFIATHFFVLSRQGFKYFPYITPIFFLWTNFAMESTKYFTLEPWTYTFYEWKFWLWWWVLGAYFRKYKFIPFMMKITSMQVHT